MSAERLRPHLILNPASAGGNTGRHQAVILSSFERAFPHGFVLDVTAETGEAVHLTREALRQGADLIVSVGGDGTSNEILNGFFEQRMPIRRSARLGFITSGTGQDVARNIGLPSDLASQIQCLTGPIRRVDLGVLTCVDADGRPVERLFLNDCQPGIASRVVQRVTPRLKRLGGFLAFGIGSTLTALTYRGQCMRLEFEDEIIEDDLLGIILANGRYAGGGMDFAPHSRLDDGLLDVVVIRDHPVLARLRNLPKIYSGSHLGLPWVISKRAGSVKISSPERVGIEVDGEFIGFLPCEVGILPRVLNVASPSG